MTDKYFADSGFSLQHLSRSHPGVSRLLQEASSSPVWITHAERTARILRALKAYGELFPSLPPPLPKIKRKEKLMVVGLGRARGCKGRGQRLEGAADVREPHRKMTGNPQGTWLWMRMVTLRHQNTFMPRGRGLWVHYMPSSLLWLGHCPWQSHIWSCKQGFLQGSIHSFWIISKGQL